MATTPIVTEVTKEQLDALVAASGLNEGLQYKVTDKDWLLIATNDNTLTPLKNRITILITETLPDYITVDKIFYDSGVIEDNGSINFDAISNFACKSILFNAITTDGDIGFRAVTFNLGGTPFYMGADMDIYDNTFLFSIPNVTQCIPTPNTIGFTIALTGTGNTFRFLIEMERIQF